MAQAKKWEKEYKDPLFVTKKAEPQNDTLRFLKFFKDQKQTDFKGLNILDLGSGTGRNSNYLANEGANAFGIEISQTAIKLAMERAEEMQIDTRYINQSMGEKFPFEDEFFDLILDVTSSNALNEKEREIYLEESFRVLKEGGNFFIRALCKDGDKNAKKLLKLFPAKEKDTYVMPKTDLTERVFSENDFRQLYGKYFEIEKIFKKSGYTIFDGQPFKRNYLLAYMKKAAK